MTADLNDSRAEAEKAAVAKQLLLDLSPLELVGDPPNFGHEMLRFFKIDPDYLHFNNGSYGTVPKAVAQHAERVSDACEARPDLYHRRTMLEHQRKARLLLAHLVNADHGEIVFVPNTTHGINTVLVNFQWRAEDILVGFTTTYGAISRTMQFISDTPPHPRLHVIQLNFPYAQPSDIASLFRTHLRALNRSTSGKVVAVIDSLSSNPGCLLPWEAMVNICKEENVWSVIDGAHSIGQHKLDMKNVDPDFFVSNCHKWLFTTKGCAVLYVPKRNQHIIRSSFPTSFGYVSPTDPQLPGAPTAPNFVLQFEWTGTINFTAYLSVEGALRFRQWVGGEDAINNYCHDLALKGGKLLAERLGTKELDESGEFTANMVNIALPFPDIAHLNVPQQLHLKGFIEDQFLFKYNTFVPTFVHNGQWWARCSSQIWIDLSDFDRLGDIILLLAKDVRNEVERLGVLEEAELV